jgi:hypothetical protein
MKLDLVEVAGHILSFIGLVASFRPPDHRPPEGCPEQEGIGNRANTSERDAALDAEPYLQVGAIMLDISPGRRVGDGVQAGGAARIVASVG